MTVLIPHRAHVHCITRQQLQQQHSSMTLQKISQASFKKAQAGIFKPTPPSAHLMSSTQPWGSTETGSMRLHCNKVHKCHVSTRRLLDRCDSARRGRAEGKNRREKSAIDQIRISHPPRLAPIHSQAQVT